MASVRLPTVLLAGLLLLSGCLGGPRNPSDGEEEFSVPDAQAGAPRPVDAGAASDALRYSVFNASGHINHDVFYLGIDPTADVPSIVAEVPRDSAGLVAELRWTGDVSDFDVAVFSPNHCPSDGSLAQTWLRFVCMVEEGATKDAPGAHRAHRSPGDVGPGELRLEIDAATIRDESSCEWSPCQWHTVAWWNVAVDASYELRLTVFYEGEVPDGFTAFDAPT